MTGQRLNLLCFDGGGVRGLSSLYILQRLMLEINSKSPPKPCEYFDMIGGTSTGGLIAIMLGRLRMSVDECIKAYIRLASRVFRKKHVLPFKMSGKLKARYSSKELQEAIQDVVRARNLEGDALLKDTATNACKVFVCATSMSTAGTVLLRSYSSNRADADLYNNAKIWEAGRATSAASSFFDPIAVGPWGQVFVDGATGANNPIKQMWNEAADMFCGGSATQLSRKLCTLVSIGTGVPDVKGFGNDIPSLGKALLGMSTETQKTEEEFYRSHPNLEDKGKYYRFNVARGLGSVGLEEAKEASRIKGLTDAYLQEQAVFSAIRRCSQVLG